ncbi:MAG: glycoside hydrolase family 15 protein [Alphaproteobacteria bacterium]|nr:glycoside hydrolase family 15 protein [Alphaproteobacteria bacterium]
MTNTNAVDDLNLAMIGNCAFSALINRRGKIVWSCLPHFDGDPVFCSLVSGSENPDHEPCEWGFWEFDMVDFERSEQHYIDNTAVLVTYLYDKEGNAVRVTDLAPRYFHYNRNFRPSTICRIVEPVSGSPRIQVRLRPRFNYGATPPTVTRGGNHVRFVSADMILRLTTDASISYVREERAFLVDRRYTFIMGPDEPLMSSVEGAGRKYLEDTIKYWREFSRNLATPFEWQDEIIRAAITLKMCSFDETGAIVAAMTTSIPESPWSGRNWDYRYCWLRDSLFTINALNRLGTTKTMEDYLRYIMNAAMMAEGKDLQPLYGISLQDTIEEIEARQLRGYRGQGPVRVGNQAYTQQQNDVWGSVILALTQAFFDKRLTRPGTIEDFHRLEQFGESALKYWDKPDAGIWEFRTIGRVHTFSAVMCWVAADRLAKIAGRLKLADRAEFWRKEADAMHASIMERAWNEELQTLVEPLDGEHLDASLLLLHEVGFIAASDPKFIKTVEAIERDLVKDGLLYRYVIEDDFSRPDVAFTVCTFWYIDALAAIGRVEEAREKFEWMLKKRNHVGLLSEDLDFKTGELWGNFPQTYSMVGLINSAMRLSKTWHEAI